MKRILLKQLGFILLIFIVNTAFAQNNSPIKMIYNQISSSDSSTNIQNKDDNDKFKKVSSNIINKQLISVDPKIWEKLFPFKNQKERLGLYPSQWIGLGIIFGSFLLCFFVLRFFFRFLFHRVLFKKYVNEIQDVDKLRLVSNLISVWTGFKLLQLFVPTLFSNMQYLDPLIKGINFGAASLMVLIVYKSVELFIFYAKRYAEKTDTQWDDQIVVVLQKFMKFSVIFLGLFFVLSTIGVNIATIIAGLSVGGLALALAAQDTVKNFIASIMIFIDKPFKIGDMIKGENFEGTVQEVGFRSTRIKTVDDSLVYIANAKLSEMTIDNKGYRVFKKYKTEVSIPYETPLYIVERFLEGIRTILLKHPYTKNSTIEVFLTNIQASGLSITISYTYKVYNQREELQHREFILLKILSLADLLQIRLFENNQVIINSKDQIVTPATLAEDIDHQLEKFFIAFEAQVITKVK